MPTQKMKAVGIWGVLAMILMGVVDQVVPGVIDWSVPVMGVPLGALIVFAATFVGGWLKDETPAPPAARGGKTLTSIAAVLLLVAVSACGAPGGQGKAVAVGETPKQQLYELDGAYKAVLDMAVAYGDACFARPPAARGNCAVVVAAIQAADERYAGIRAQFDRVLESAGDRPVELAGLVVALEEFKAYVIRRIVADTAGADTKGGAS